MANEFRVVIKAQFLGTGLWLKVVCHNLETRPSVLTRIAIQTIDLYYNSFSILDRFGIGCNSIITSPMSTSKWTLSWIK